LDKKIAETSKEADYLLSIYQKYSNSAKTDPEIEKLKIRHQKMTEKKEKIREEHLKAARDDQDKETLIYNKQDAFLKIEEAFRNLCSEYNIHEQVNIGEIESENSTVDTKLAKNRKEFSQKVQNDFDAKMDIVKEINDNIKNETKILRNYDEQLNQDMERVKNSIYHFDTNRKKRRELKKSLDQSIQDI
jgi:hypothetical protein